MIEFVHKAIRKHLAMTPEEWEEHEHPRDNSGQFTKKGSYGTWESKGKPHFDFWIIDNGKILESEINHEDDLWDYFVETNEPGFEGLPKTDDVTEPDEENDRLAMWDEVCDKVHDKAFEQKGYIRVAFGTEIGVGDFSSGVLKRVAKGLYKQYGDDARDLTYNIENLRNNKFAWGVPFDVLKRGSTSQLRQYF